MNYKLILFVSPLVATMFLFGSKPEIKGNEHSAAMVSEDISAYRDTLVGKFNGVDTDTLICEPIGAEIDDEMFGKLYLEWRVYTTKGTVGDLKIGNTTGIIFQKEGDLDGNKTEEWGYLSQWPIGNWREYEIFTCEDGKWKLMVDPVPIWRDQIPEELTKSEIARPSGQNGFIRIKMSDVIDEATNWIVVDTLFSIHPREYTYDLVEW